MKNVVLLGSTGSIGTSTIKVAEDLPDHVRLLGLAAGGNWELLAQQTLKHRPTAISITDPRKARELQAALGNSTEVFSGDEGLLKLATLPAADIVLIAIVGTAGLQPALAAIRAGKDIAVRIGGHAGYVAERSLGSGQGDVRELEWSATGDGSDDPLRGGRNCYNRKQEEAM